MVPTGGGVRTPQAKVALSTSSVFPESVARAFELAAATGYDGVEVMVWTDPVSQDLDSLLRLRDQYAVPVLALHAPCLLIAQRVWGREPWAKLQRTAALATALDTDLVVVHPPFRWQRRYAGQFVAGLHRLGEESGVRFAVENMFPVRVGAGQVSGYGTDWTPVRDDHRHFTLDTSHTSVSGTDPLALLAAMGERLAHVHLADGTGLRTDEHLVPGRGTQPCAQVLERLAELAYAGAVVVEISTSRAATADHREAAVVAALAFTRLHLGTSAPPRREAPRRPPPAGPVRC